MSLDTRTCTDFLAFDLAELVTNPPAEWVGLKTLGAVMGRDLAALRHPGLAQIREQFDLIQPVESGTYNRPIEASLLIAPSDLLHLEAPQVCLAPPLDLSSFIQPGERLAVMQTTMIKQFNKVVIQPWAEPGTVLGQVVQTFLEKVEGPNSEMQEVCKRNPPVLRPRPGLLCVARSGEGVNRRWCRAKVSDNVLTKLYPESGVESYAIFGLFDNMSRWFPVQKNMSQLNSWIGAMRRQSLTVKRLTLPFPESSF